MREKLIKYGYHWLGMKEIDYDNALNHFKCNVAVYLLYEDNTENQASSLKEIKDHYNNGGKFGKELSKYDNYVVFVLGRDLLKGILPNENDIAYNICVDIAKDFEISEFNVNTKGLYECLEDYIKARFYVKDGKLTYMGVDLDEMFGGY